jgi:hypothetical protein
MPDQEISVAGDRFYAGALRRITRIMQWLMILAPVAAWLAFGWRIALGLLCGSLIAYLNFYWLEKVVAALARKVVEQTANEPAQGVVARFVFRYVLMGLAAYATLTVFPASLHGLLAGLFLPVAGIACEAAYETYSAFSRGF